jgi:sec-independent protein translocase protein TatB
MFEVGFSEILLIFGIALLVLGPERLPKLAADVGRWAGRARAMARQLRTQLEQEVQYDPLAETGQSHHAARSMTPSIQPPVAQATPAAQVSEPTAACASSGTIHEDSAAPVPGGSPPAPAQHPPDEPRAG